MLKATEGFVAWVDGTLFSLRKGEEFRGSAKAAAQLERIGLLAEKPERRKKVKND